RWVTELAEFNDDPEGSNEKVLEAIQMTWMDERED
ncbi:MAG: Fe-S cluster assembly protein IscX, partial [Thiohalospira sp.]